MPDLPTPSLVIDAAVVRRNLRRAADYAAAHGIAIRPHTKTHKSVKLARMQIDAGARGLTVAKVGEALAMSAASDDILIAYPTVDALRAAEAAKLAKTKTIRVAIDSQLAADSLSAAAKSAGATVGVLVDIDVGPHRTGVQTPAAALALAQYVTRQPGLRLDGILFYPGHIWKPVTEQAEALAAVEAILAETISLWRKAGLEAKIVSGGSTPTLFQSHLVPSGTEVRPGTYIFNDMNCVRGGFSTLEDCAARIVSTVVSTAVPGQVVLDAGTKTLTSDRNALFPDSGHGLIVEFPEAKIAKLSEEHAQVDIAACPAAPKLGQTVTIIPNHICPCVNLQDRVWWCEPGAEPQPLTVDARGKVF
jgi:D-serine deaminase-like pyridoxal phosphate-dependent protein